MRVAAELARWRIGVEAAVAGGLPGGVQAGGLEVERRVVRRVGVREVRPDGDDLRGAVGLGLGGGVEQVGPVGGLHAVAGEPGVDLEVQPGGAPGLRAPASTAARWAREATDRSMSAATAAAKSSSGTCSQDSTGAAMPRGAQLERLVDRADAQPGGARRERGLGDGTAPCP